MIHQVKKVWGSEDWLVNNEMYCSKFLNLNRGYECSFHFHKIKDETFYILGGSVELFYFDLVDLPWIKKSVQLEVIQALDLAGKLRDIKKITLNSGDQFRIKPYMLHKFRAKTLCAKVLEVSTTHFEEDSYRITPSRVLE